MRRLLDFLREIEWFAVLATLLAVVAIIVILVSPEAWGLALVLAIVSLTATHLIR